jgi:hypothetical protein
VGRFSTETNTLHAGSGQEALPEVSHVQGTRTALRKGMCTQGSAAELGTYELCSKHGREGVLNMDKTNIENLSSHMFFCFGFYLQLSIQILTLASLPLRGTPCVSSESIIAMDSLLRTKGLLYEHASDIRMHQSLV